MKTLTDISSWTNCKRFSFMAKAFRQRQQHKKKDMCHHSGKKQKQCRITINEITYSGGNLM